MLAPLAVFFAASKLLGVLAYPGTWALALLALAAFLWGRRRMRAALGVVAAGIAVAVTFSSPVVASSLERWLESRAERSYRPSVHYDALVILGSDPVRVDAAGPVVRTGKVSEVVYSGWIRARETERIRAKVLSWGLPPHRLVLVQSRNTRENATETVRTAADRGWRTMLVVTSATHAPRAAACFRAAGWDPDFLPVHEDDGQARSPWPSARALSRSSMVFHEVIGLAVYRAMGYAR